MSFTDPRKPTSMVYAVRYRDRICRHRATSCSGPNFAFASLAVRETICEWSISASRHRIISINFLIARSLRRRQRRLCPDGAAANRSAISHTGPRRGNSSSWRCLPATRAWPPVFVASDGAGAGPARSRISICQYLATRAQASSLLGVILFLPRARSLWIRDRRTRRSRRRAPSPPNGHPHREPGSFGAPAR